MTDMSRSKVIYCPKTGKQCFDRRTQAEKVAYHTKRRLHCATRGSVYLCNECGKYHVTHYTYDTCKDFRTRQRKKVFYMMIEY